MRRNGGRTVIDGPVGAARLRRRFQAAAVVAVALVQLTAGAALAEATTVAPPYASDAESCSGNGTCEAAADAATGELRVNAAAVETFDDSGAADAEATVVAVHTLGTEANAINYTVNFDVLEGVAQSAGSVCLFYSPCTWAEVEFVARAQHRDCAECFGIGVEGCFASGDGADSCTVPSGRLPLVFTVTNRGGGSVPAGTVEISAQLNAVVSTDSEGSASGHAIVRNIAAETNNLPVAVDDSASTSVGSPVTINVLANDFDPDGDPLTVTWGRDPANGSVAVNPDQTVTYTPNGCFSGTDSFEYRISDDKGGWWDYGVVTVRVRKIRGSSGC